MFSEFWAHLLCLEILLPLDPQGNKKITSQTRNSGNIQIEQKTPTNFQDSLVCKHTPTSITWICGLNMVRLLVAVILKGGVIPLLVHCPISSSLKAFSLFTEFSHRNPLVHYIWANKRGNTLSVLKLAMSWEKPAPVSKQAEVLV